MRQWQDGAQSRASATLRVPAQRLSEVLDEIRKQAVRVDDENTTGQDVSEEFVDLNARITNLRATEVELRQLLTTVRERTQKASDVLEVHRELASVRGQIDSYQGRMDYLKQMTAMSTINVELFPNGVSAPIVQTTWSPVAVARDAARMLVASLETIGTLVIWLVVYAAPLLALLGLVIFAGKKVAALSRRRAESGD